MTIFLDGIAAQLYRGIGPEVQYIAPFAEMNFFIGANNAGKSTVLSLLVSQLDRLAKGELPKPLAEHERHRGSQTGQFLVAVGNKAESVETSLFDKISAANHSQGLPRDSRLRADLRKNCGQLSVHGLVWVSGGRGSAPLLFPDPDESQMKNSTGAWEQIWRSLTNQIGGDPQSRVSETLRRIAQLATRSRPPVFLIPAKRVLGAKGEAFDDLTGRGLIDHLAGLQNPDWNGQEKKQRFDRINRFLQEVTGKLDARLEVPSEREHLLVHMDNKVLPLSSLGTGIHEVVLIAAFCTIHDNSIMCIEEPEIHLHPLLQRKLVRYLQTNTGSQYFIATHSSAFIDTPDAHIFHVTNDGAQTRIKAVATKDGKGGILDDLGYRASDILQANAVIWVEGPSDRTYLNHWINAADNRLIEGIHYAVMFYGGALVSHLSGLCCTNRLTGFTL